MPQERYFFAPTTGEFRDVRSFALQVRHVAFANHLFFGTILGEKPPAGVGGNGPESLKSKEQIVHYLKESFALGHCAIASITPANLVTIIENVPAPLFNTRLATVARSSRDERVQLRSLHEMLYSAGRHGDVPFTRPVAVLLGEAMALTAARHFGYENRIRELIQLFVRERDPDKLNTELQYLLMLERTVPKMWRE
jgi:hypothetical protein